MTDAPTPTAWEIAEANLEREISAAIRRAQRQARNEAFTEMAEWHDEREKHWHQWDDISSNAWEDAHESSAAYARSRIEE